MGGRSNYLLLKQTLKGFRKYKNNATLLIFFLFLKIQLFSIKDVMFTYNGIIFFLHGQVFFKCLSIPKTVHFNIYSHITTALWGLQ